MTKALSTWCGYAEKNSRAFCTIWRNSEQVISAVHAREKELGEPLTDGPAILTAVAESLSLAGGP